MAPVDEDKDPEVYVTFAPIAEDGSTEDLLEVDGHTEDVWVTRAEGYERTRVGRREAEARARGEVRVKWR